MTKLLTVAEVAEILSVTESALRSMIRRKEVPFVKISSRVVRFVPEDVLKLIDERKVSDKRSGR